ncbi:MAG: hypothetical protein ACFE8G_06620 [Candidatus Hermodarchaeota archaeon]
MPRNNSIAGFLIGLIVFLGFGVFFLFGWGRFNIFNVISFFPMIFVIIIIGIAGVASANSRRSNCCPPKSQNQYQYYTQEVPRTNSMYVNQNPYVVKNSTNSTVRTIYIEEDEPEKPITKFCQYCGTKKDRNAIYCHNCGTKL